MKRIENKTMKRAAKWAAEYSIDAQEQIEIATYPEGGLADLRINSNSDFGQLRMDLIFHSSGSVSVNQRRNIARPGEVPQYEVRELYYPGDGCLEFDRDTLHDLIDLYLANVTAHPGHSQMTAPWIAEGS